MAITEAELRERHGFHPADTDVKRNAHELVRQLTLDLALDLAAMLPESREKSLALTAVQEAMMWANASLAVHGGPVDPPAPLASRPEVQG